MLSERDLVPTDWSQAGQLQLLLDNPVDEFSEREKKRAPVFAVVLQTVPVAGRQLFLFSSIFVAEVKRQINNPPDKEGEKI